MKPSAMAQVGYAVIKMLVVLALGLGALALSIVASVWGLTAVLVGAALAGFVVLRAYHPASRDRADRPAAHRPRQAMVITAAMVLGFFVLLTVASQVWPH